MVFNCSFMISRCCSLQMFDFFSEGNNLKAEINQKMITCLGVQLVKYN